MTTDDQGNAKKSRVDERVERARAELAARDEVQRQARERLRKQREEARRRLKHAEARKRSVESRERRAREANLRRALADALIALLRDQGAAMSVSYGDLAGRLPTHDRETLEQLASHSGQKQKGGEGIVVPPQHHSEGGEDCTEPRS